MQKGELMIGSVSKGGKGYRGGFQKEGEEIIRGKRQLTTPDDSILSECLNVLTLNLTPDDSIHCLNVLTLKCIHVKGQSGTR